MNGSDIGPMLLGSRLCGLESFIQLLHIVANLLVFLIPSTLYFEATEAVWQALGNWGQVQPLAVELVVLGSTAALY